jgi:hypothetical protein
MGLNQSANTETSRGDAVDGPLEMPGMSESSLRESARLQLIMNACGLATPIDRVHFVRGLSEVLPTEARVPLFKELVGQLLQVIRREKPGVPSIISQLLTDAFIDRVDNPVFFDIRGHSQVAETLTLQSLILARMLPEESLAAVVQGAIKSVTDEMAGNELILCILCEMKSMYQRASSSKDLFGMKLEPRSWANSLFAAINPQP